jgi:putative transcriptional regulator
MKNKITTITLNKNYKPKTKIDFKRLENMTEEELTANALSDPDNLPLTKLEMRQFKPVHPKHAKTKSIDIKNIRKKLHLSQEKFAEYFGVSIRTLQDWEQHRHNPSKTARNFLLVVSKEPRAVQRALG